MRGTWVSLALLVGLGFSGSACRKNSDPAPRPAPPAAPALIADVRDQTGKDAGAVKDAGPTAAAPTPAPIAPLTYPPGERVPIESLFEVMYTPGETLPDKLQRRIRFRLKDRSRAPIALHHIIDIPKPDGGREVFALYESSVYEDCVQGYANRKQGRDHCLGKLERLYGGDEGPRLNRACVALGAVRAVFGPPGPGETADTGGSLAITSIAFTDALCEVRSYNHVLVADVDGDKRIELYVDITTSKETAADVRLPGHEKSVVMKKYSSQRHLYILSGNNIANAELSIAVGDLMPSDPMPSDPAHEDPEDPIELRDIDRDGHLDVIETKPCYWTPSPGAFFPCESAPEAMHFSGDKRIAYLYDVQQDAYKEGVAMEAPAEKAAPAVAPSPTQQGAEAAAPAPEAAAPAPVPSDASRTAGGAPARP